MQTKLASDTIDDDLSHLSDHLDTLYRQCHQCRAAGEGTDHAAAFR